ncbi:MAG: hypothetical protein KC445_22120, partial [Anaerolineales bacterium]|nr:hypothetical protein [Anaerolineales bacterium]
MSKERERTRGKIKDFADLSDFLLMLLGVVSLVSALAYLRLGFARVVYPYALDLVEEGMVMQAWR